MSTYLDPRYPEKHGSYSDVPEDVQAFLRYLESTLRRSPRTVNAYYVDLRIFLRFMVRYQQQIDKRIPDSELAIHDLDTTFWRTINYADLLEYTIYLKNERNNSRATNCRKVSSIKGFFRYLTKMGKISDDPSKELDLPKPARSLPKYLSLEESLELLKDIQSDFYEREYCMLTLFLNCGMRLSELVSINLSDFKDDTIRITGKGSKQRLVYLNPACVDAVKQYLAARAKLENLKDKQALFVSRRTGRRLSPRRVEQIVSHQLKCAGLDGYGYSPHKLRHTAATLMYRHGQADMLTLKEILGHEHVSTTEIYTHLDTKKLHDVVNSSPLAGVRMPRPADSRGLPEETEKKDDSNEP